MDLDRSAFTKQTPNRIFAVVIMDNMTNHNLSLRQTGHAYFTNDLILVVSLHTNISVFGLWDAHCVSSLQLTEDSTQKGISFIA